MKYRVTWTEVFHQEAYIEAPGEEEAKESFWLKYNHLASIAGRGQPIGGNVSTDGPQELRVTPTARETTCP